MPRFRRNAFTLINLRQVACNIILSQEFFILQNDGIPIIGIIRADELEDYWEVRDPKVREHIRKSNAERQAGKGRPLEEFLAEL